METLFNVDETDSEYKAYCTILPYLKETVEDNYAPLEGLRFQKLASCSSVYYYSSLLFRICIRKKSSYISFSTNKPELFSEMNLYQTKTGTGGAFYRCDISDPKDLVNYSEQICMILNKAIMGQSKEFDICDLYLKCSDTKKCVHPKREFALHCGYKRILKNGSIYFGKNRNIDSNGSGVIKSSQRPFKGKSLLEITDNYTAIDVETTGLDPHYDRIIQISCVKIRDGNIVDKYSSLVNPEMEIDEFITDLTGITNEMVADAPTMDLIVSDVKDFLGDDIIVGHNVSFDINFVYDAFQRAGLKGMSNDCICTRRLAHWLFPGWDNYQLWNLVSHFNLDSDRFHDSMSDTMHALRCYEYMKQFVRNNGIDLQQMIKERKRKQDLRAKDIKPTTTNFDPDDPFFGKTFVFTGTLERMQRKDAMQLVVDHGGSCGDNISKKIDYLVLGDYSQCKTVRDGKSTKMKKAESLILAGHDLKIISEDVFFGLLEDYEALSA